MKDDIKSGASYKYSISIIEDSEIHLEWLSEKVSENDRFLVVSMDRLGRTGIESVKKNNPALVLLDFQLSDITGLEVAKRIKLNNPNLKIFALTAHTESSIIKRLIDDKNIDAIAIKGSSYFEDNFLSAIEHVLNGETYLDPSLLTKLRDSGNLNSLNELTKREFEVFIQSCSEKSDVQIAKDLFVEVAYIKNLKSRILKKIKEDEVDNIIDKLVENANI